MKIIAHVGDCGYVADVDFEKEDAYDPDRWQVVCEELRARLLYYESLYNANENTIWRK